ncbi:MAG: peptidoglycan recognition family protein [Bradymonadaceae bacterium]
MKCSNDSIDLIALIKWCPFLFLAAGLLMACGEDDPKIMGDHGIDQGLTMVGYDDVDPPRAGEDPIFEISIATPEETARLFEGGVARLESPVPFKQVGWMMDALDVSELQYQAQAPDGSWTPWQDVHVYWSEGIMHNAHILLDFATSEVRLRGGESILATTFEFREEVVARQEIVTAENTPGRPGLDHGLDDDLRITRQAQAPGSLVIPRADWGAINPSKICGSVVAPYRMTVHHTAIPSGDGGDAAARMRGMQSYHINTNKWCDIGYHFVIAQTGKIYQGRSRSDRPGAHTGGQNSGNVGMAFIADFTTQTPTTTQLDAGGRITKWIHETHNVPLTRTAVKGHREWPGQSTSCPGANMINRITTLLEKAGGDGATDPPPPTVTYDVKMEVNYIGLENFYVQGSSAQLPDAMPGDTFQAEILVTNDSSGPLRGVQLGYWIEEPFITATNYVIQTDHPEKDKSSWKTNDADGAEGNPAKAGMGPEGSLIMHAFGAGETKRVLIDVQAERYSIGFADHPDVRGWIKNIDDVYAQAGFGADPTTNNVGSHLRAYAEMDILSRDEWMFKGKTDADLEGWSGAEADHFEELKINTREDLGGLLSMQVTGAGAHVVSPEWTRIDADQYDQLVLQVRSHDGSHVKALYWTRDGESFSEDRVVRFEVLGDGEFHNLVVPVGHHKEWSGTVNRIRLDLIEDRAPVDNGWQDLGMVYFQASDTQQTTSFTEEFLAAPPIALMGTGGEDIVVPPGEAPVPDFSRPMSPSAGGDGYQHVSVNNGCSMANTPSGQSPAGLLLIGLLGGLLLGRRQKH